MTFKRVGIIGSGIMGSGIAEVVTRSGFEVSLRARSPRSAEHCLGRLSRSLGRQVDKGKLDAEERDAALSRVRVVNDLHGLELCELVIESVVEDLAVKSDLFAELGRICPDDTVLATNTSTLPVVTLAMASGRPDRVCGMHFFNPAPVMPLVEVVAALTTSKETETAAWGFATDCGKQPVLVADRAGFIVNSLLFPYLNGAVRLAENGVASQADIDIAMRGGCGFPMGPFELLDLVGLDTSLAILEVLHAESGDAGCQPAPLLRHMVTANHLGRKTGQGFYSYPTAIRGVAAAPSPSSSKTSKTGTA